MKRIIERKREKRHIIESMVVSHFSQFPDSDKAIIEIKEDKLTRSGAQNDIYWAWISIIGPELGYNKDETHRIMRHKFLKYDTTTDKDGTVVSELRSTTKLKVKDFSEYLNDIDRLMGEYGIMLPHDETHAKAMGIRQ